MAILGAFLTAGLAEFSANPNALVNAEARAHLQTAELVALQGALEGSLRTIFMVCAIVVGVALAAAVTLPRGQVRDAHGERMVMAEMATIDAEHEPEG